MTRVREISATVPDSVLLFPLSCHSHFHLQKGLVWNHACSVKQERSVDVEGRGGVLLLSEGRRFKGNEVEAFYSSEAVAFFWGIRRRKFSANLLRRRTASVLI
ncbi:hypothetical protein NE237_004661 [Protea cynaroides]|uniref:Uncharacterized protein n=1 Tax=Protea cynaroides TaxID=273540 RepID=A0A9Q0QTT7_9MAGN|nr:hypothetical protein NE237_004661 [Protea cynaroides]